MIEKDKGVEEKRRLVLTLYYTFTIIITVHVCAVNVVYNQIRDSPTWEMYFVFYFVISL